MSDCAGFHCPGFLCVTRGAVKDIRDNPEKIREIIEKVYEEAHFGGWLMCRKNDPEKT